MVRSAVIIYSCGEIEVQDLHPCPQSKDIVLKKYNGRQPIAGSN